MCTCVGKPMYSQEQSHGYDKHVPHVHTHCVHVTVRFEASCHLNMCLPGTVLLTYSIAWMSTYMYVYGQVCAAKVVSMCVHACLHVACLCVQFDLFAH